MDPEEIQKKLRKNVNRLRAESKIASDQFDARLRAFPSGLPHPDGVQRIRNASLKSAAARTCLMSAIKIETDFLVNGTLPEEALE